MSNETRNKIIETFGKINIKTAFSKALMDTIHESIDIAGEGRENSGQSDGERFLFKFSQELSNKMQKDSTLDTNSYTFSCNRIITTNCSSSDNDKKIKYQRLECKDAYKPEKEYIREYSCKGDFSTIDNEYLYDLCLSHSILLTKDEQSETAFPILVDSKNNKKLKIGTIFSCELESNSSEKEVFKDFQKLLTSDAPYKMYIGGFKQGTSNGIRNYFKKRIRQLSFLFDEFSNSSKNYIAFVPYYGKDKHQHNWNNITKPHNQFFFYSLQENIKTSKNIDISHIIDTHTYPIELHS